MFASYDIRNRRHLQVTTFVSHGLRMSLADLYRNETKNIYVETGGHITLADANSLDAFIPKPLCPAV